MKVNPLDRPLIEVRAVVYAPDGVTVARQHARQWSMHDVERGGKPDLQQGPLPWMLEPRKSWPHPQDPIIYSFLVADEDWQTAVDWIDNL